MKVSTAFFTVCLVAVSGIFPIANAQASVVYEARLERFELDAQIASDRPVEHGLVVIDFNTNEVKLSLEHARGCEEGTYCTSPVRPDLGIKLPIVSVEQNECGVVTIVAARDEAAVQVVDNASSTCNRITILPPTSVALKIRSFTESGDPIETHSAFEGAKLEKKPFEDWHVIP